MNYYCSVIQNFNNFNILTSEWDKNTTKTCVAGKTLYASHDIAKRTNGLSWDAVKGTKKLNNANIIVLLEKIKKNHAPATIIAKLHQTC